MPRESRPAAAIATHNWVTQFLAELPARANALEWTARFRDALSTVVRVDRISVDVNVGAMAPTPIDADRDMTIVHHLTDKGIKTESVSIAATNTTSDRVSAHVSRLEAEMKSGEFNTELYRTPHIEAFQLDDETYLGVIVLWTRKSSPESVDDAIEALRRWTSVIKTLMIDCACRHQSQQPISGAFYLALDRMRKDGRLTVAEQRVIVLRLLGHSYKEIAIQLRVRSDTVGKQLSAVYAKTQTHGLPELYSKYFTPRLR